jgi:uncharacterized protein
MDITPKIPEGRQVVERYGAGRFTISRTVHQGSVLVTAEATSPWAVAEAGGITLEALEPLIAMSADLDVVLLGCGPRAALLPRPLRDALKNHGLVVEAMDTGAAARTYNVLMAEERPVAAALIAVE